MDDRELADRVLEHLDTDRATALSQEVCRIPSVLGEEGPLAKFLADVMKEAGFEAVDLQPVLPDRPNATGEVSFGPGRRVVLTGHLDTKPVSHGWATAGPFSGAIVGDAVYGHGIMDMKAALACEIVAIEALARSGLPLAGTAAMSAVADHMGDQAGAIAYFDTYPADLCVLGELTDNQICLGHRRTEDTLDGGGLKAHGLIGAEQVEPIGNRATNDGHVRKRRSKRPEEQLLLSFRGVLEEDREDPPGLEAFLCLLVELVGHQHDRASEVGIDEGGGGDEQPAGERFHTAQSNSTASVCIPRMIDDR